MRPPKRAQSAARAPLNRIMGTEANVRLLRAVCLESSPMSRTELGRAANLEAKGAHLAANKLLELGLLQLVGRGIRQLVELNQGHPLARQLQSLFQVERTLAEDLVTSLKRLVGEQAPELIGAWIQGPFARGEDRPGEPIQVGLLAHSRTLGGALSKLRKALAEVEGRYDTTIELVGYTRPDLAVATDQFLAGDSTELLALLFQRLLDSASARRGAADIEQQLHTLADFARKDIAALHRALEKAGRTGWVSRDERDALFITARHGA